MAMQNTPDARLSLACRACPGLFDKLEIRIHWVGHSARFPTAWALDYCMIEAVLTSWASCMGLVLGSPP